jgi:hypothetical protein
MKKFVALSLVGLLSSFAMASDGDLKAEIELLKKQMAELQKAQKAINIDALKAQISEVKAHDANDNIKWDVDFRTAYEHFDYDVKGMNTETNGLWTNKLILGMAAQPLDELIFKGSLGVYKYFGHNMTTAYNGFQNMDWYPNQTPSDATVRLREAYFLYLGDIDGMPWTASFGRRPSTDGFLTNLREDNALPASPIGHNINMEFDGASFKFDIGEKLDIEGMYIKLCLGRGNSNANGKYAGFTGFNGANLTMAGMMTPSMPYYESAFDSANMDLAGIMAQLYNDGQYKVMFNYFQGWNMMGANFFRTSEPGTPADPSDDTWGMNLVDVGDLSGGALSIQVDGLSEDNDFLFDTTVFASFAWSKTDPQGVHNIFNPADPTGVTAMTEMLGSPNGEMGTSYYVGANFPCLVVDDARIGIEYNHGSKYWRSFTYGEDTLIGSKLATRGDAYELYYNLPLLGKNLTAQLRYTYINYDYSGSDMFFGSTGTPMTAAQAAAQGMAFVDSASSIRAYLRYRY